MPQNFKYIHELLFYYERIFMQLKKYPNKINKDRKQDFYTTMDTLKQTIIKEIMSL